MDPLAEPGIPSPRRSPVRVAAADLQGVEARLVEIEAFVRGHQGGPPRVIGLADTAVRESLERVRTSFSSLGLGFPRGQLVVNLAPARARKVGTGFDLGIALSLACLAGHVPRRALRGLLACAELGLDGTLRPVPGVLAMVELTRRLGMPRFACASESADLAARGSGDECDILGTTSLSELLEILRGRRRPEPPRRRHEASRAALPQSRLARVRGQESARRALEIAAAGGHHLLMSGPPGCGKTLLASCIPELLPPLSETERLEVLKIRSAFGEPKDCEIAELFAWGRSPFRAPHHTVSYAGLVGGGQPPRPGEITLAHRGVLFLDEFPEFRREALEALRQPLESGEIHVRRAGAELFLPARFQLVAAMNPCPCGMLGHPRLPCRDTPASIARYRRRISGPLLDRIDLQLRMQPVAVESLLEDAPSDPRPVQEARARIDRARERQRERGALNRDLGDAELQPGRILANCARQVLAREAAAARLSARAVGRVLRVARTVADLEGAELVRAEDLGLALHFRLRPMEGGAG